MSKKRTKTGLGIAIFFLLCGLIIGILGTYILVVTKHYKGEILKTDPLLAILQTKYPDKVKEVNYDTRERAFAYEPNTSLRYDITTAEKIEDLPYTTLSNFIWITIILGLVYIGIGIKSLIKEDWLFKQAGENKIK
jgi:hypothetical protein